MTLHHVSKEGSLSFDGTELQYSRKLKLKLKLKIFFSANSVNYMDTSFKVVTRLSIVKTSIFDYSERRISNN